MRMPRQQKKTRVSGEDDSTGADTDGEEGLSAVFSVIVTIVFR